MARQPKRATKGLDDDHLADLRQKIAGLEKQLARCTAERSEAVEQRTAAGEILRVISRSPAEIQPVFEAIVENAARLCEAEFSAVARFEDGLLHLVALNNMSAKETAAFHSLFPRPPTRDFIMGRAILDSRPVHFEDVLTERDYDTRTREVLQSVAGYRSFLGVPIFREGRPIGVIGCGRREVKPFSATQIELLQTFADQAAIAIENVRLFSELESRNRDIGEALDQQTATAEVLQVINSSPGDLAPVFDAMLEKALRLCGSAFGILNVFDGQNFHGVAMRGVPPAFAEFRAGDPAGLGPGTAPARVLAGEDVVHNLDLMNEEAYRRGDPYRRAIVDLGGARSHLAVALRKDNALLGMLTVYRQEVRAFSVKEIALLQNFAAQAVIAIENARLLTETREALQQQTATAEVLQVINSSPGDLAPVFEAMLDKATHLCEASYGMLYRCDGDLFRAVALHAVPTAFADFLHEPFQADSRNALGRLVGGERLVHMPDLREDAAYLSGEPLRMATVELGGARTYLGVPLRKDGVLLGAIGAYRREVRPFSEKQIALLENFAAQAVIAMENARLLTETREALEQQTATAEVLQVINSSPGDLAPVFEAILDKAHTLCGATLGSLFLFDGELFRAAAVHGYPEDLAQRLRQGIVLSATTQLLDSNTRWVHNPDLTLLDTPTARAVSGRGGVRTNLMLPLRKDGRLLGAISCNRQEVRPFAEKEIALLQNFAAQAVIAMENARLLTETREALEQQTATAEVLQVINSSPGDFVPVFEAMLEKATRLCNAAFGIMWTYQDERFHAAALHGVPAEFADHARVPQIPHPEIGLGRVLRGEDVVINIDVADEDVYRAGDPLRRALVEIAGARSKIDVALRKDGALLGDITIFRKEVQPFSGREIALLQNFAAQAVIAIENARLLNELRDRTRDLQESLEYQTATSDVLKVISQSGSALEPMLEALVETAARICDADKAVLGHLRDGLYRMGASVGFTPEYKDYRALHPIKLDRGTAIGRMALERRAVHIEDTSNDPEYTDVDARRLGRFRSVLSVPLFREDTVIGGLFLARSRVEPFTDKQIELVTTFADQAVIAIENARLLNELRNRTEEVMQREAELRVTFDNMADGVVMFDGDMRLAAWNRNFQQILHLPDTLLAERLSYADYFRHLAERGEFGAIDADAELRRYQENVGRQWSSERTRPDGRVIEVRNNPVPGGGLVLIYSDITERKEAEARLRAARDTAESALRDLKAAQANLIHAEKMASLGQLTAGIAHEIKNPLNFVNNFAGLSVELLDELKETATPAVAALADDTRAEIDEIVEMLTGNLAKIAEHGRRADGIVKSMLLHSRGGSGERQSVDINAVVEESLNLAYHGARAQDQNFNITLERDLDRAIAPIELVPQDITRVFLNLFGNGFYAAHKRGIEANDAKFKPSLKVTTRGLGSEVEIRVRDNGSGIAPEIRDKLFQPFFTTKPTGEGTGLGLSISYDIITQQHGGTIAVDSVPDEFTEFTIRLPRSGGRKQQG